MEWKLTTWKEILFVWQKSCVGNADLYSNVIGMNNSFNFFSIFTILDKWLIPNHLRDTVYKLRKARVLVLIHISLILISVIFTAANLLVFHNVKTPLLAYGTVVGVCLIWFFQRWGNLKISGNLLALVVFTIFASSIGSTGGLYSDNLLWLVTVPLIALLFANKRSGFFWLMALEGITLYYFLQEKNEATSLHEQTHQFNDLYYYTTYAGLFLMIVCIVFIFALGQEMIIKALNEKQQELSKQKSELARQTKFLREAEQKLISSNKELEQFAYAASHDLKEPLRMISSYVSLIKRKLGPQLDSSTSEYMGFVTEGVTRMESLLNDLLEYSRLGHRPQQAKMVDLNEVIMAVTKNLITGIKESQAVIYSNQLPCVKASSTEMIQLFQNLISNSIKFHRAGIAPVVVILHEKKEDAYVFHLHDNGIGIPLQYRQSIFNLFERLHSRQEYEGTGIGLATCKKIVSNLGGSIWVESEAAEGSTFTFTIPTNSEN